jgi:hypothetical protein
MLKKIVILLFLLTTPCLSWSANIYVDTPPAESGSGWDGINGHSYTGTPGAGTGYGTVNAALDAMSSGDDINGKITVVNSAVNVNNYTHWNTTWNYRYMNHITPMTKNWDPPNFTSENFIIVEFPITPGIHNNVWLLGASSGWDSVAGWLLNSDGDTVVKLLKNSISSSDSSTANGRNYTIGPNGESDRGDRYHTWHAFPVHKDDIATHKTITDTIKVAIKVGVGHPYAYIHISGLATSENRMGFLEMRHLLFGSHANWAGAYQGGVYKLGNYGAYLDGYMQQLTANQSVSAVRIPIFDTNYDVIVGFLRHCNNHFVATTEYTITGTSYKFYEQEYPVGRMAKCINANQSTNTRDVAIRTILIPKDILLENVKTDAVKGHKYIELDFHNRSPVNAFWHSIYVESKIPREMA